MTKMEKAFDSGVVSFEWGMTTNKNLAYAYFIKFDSVARLFKELKEWLREEGFYNYTYLCYDSELDLTYIKVYATFEDWRNRHDC